MTALDPDGDADDVLIGGVTIDVLDHGQTVILVVQAPAMPIEQAVVAAPPSTEVTLQLGIMAVPIVNTGTGTGTGGGTSAPSTGGGGATGTTPGGSTGGSTGTDSGYSPLLIVGLDDQTLAQVYIKTN